MFPCSNGATLIFEHKIDPNNQMATYLLINKNNEMIPFSFGRVHCRIKENGQMVTKVIHSGLGVFAKTLDAYLSVIGSDLHLNKLSEEELDNQKTLVQ